MPGLFLNLCLVQDEEEVPPESGKDDKAETPKDEAAKKTQDDSEKSAGEDKSPEKTGTEEAGSKTDAKVRSITCNLLSILKIYIEKRPGSAHLVLNVTIFLLVKEEKDREKSGNTEAEKDVEKKAKPQKKSKLSEDITVELVIRDILDPTADDVTSSKKK